MHYVLALLRVNFAARVSLPRGPYRGTGRADPLIIVIFCTPSESGARPPTTANLKRPALLFHQPTSHSASAAHMDEPTIIAIPINRTCSRSISSSLRLERLEPDKCPSVLGRFVRIGTEWLRLKPAISLRFSTQPLIRCLAN